MTIKDFPSLIKRYRKHLRLSQTEFSKKYGVTHASVSGWESGKYEAPYRVLYDCLSLVQEAEYSLTMQPMNVTIPIKIKD